MQRTARPSGGVQFGERIAPLCVDAAGTGELLARHWERIWSLAPDPSRGTTVEVSVAAGSDAQLAEERRRGPLLRPCAERSGMRMSTSRFLAMSPMRADVCCLELRGEDSTMKSRRRYLLKTVAALTLASGIPGRVGEPAHSHHQCQGVRDKDLEQFRKAGVQVIPSPGLAEERHSEGAFEAARA